MVRGSTYLRERAAYAESHSLLGRAAFRRRSLGSLNSGVADADHLDMTQMVGDLVGTMFVAFPHVVGCPTCRAYAADRLGRYPLATLVSVTLGHHHAGHAADLFLVASEHFAVGIEPTRA